MNKTIKGHCSSCLFLKQDWEVIKDEECTTPQQLKVVIGNWCFICDVFKRLDGYCDFYEEA